jgi:molybdopterin-guanine dinucleotide biosynthesis protein A
VTVGAVLAGGSGRRFGQPKATVAYQGRSLVEHAVSLVEGCDATIVVSRAEIALPALDVPVVLDRPGPSCPLNAMATAFVEAAATPHLDVVVLACDLPLAGPLVARLLSTPLTTDALVARDPTGRSQPLCARYRVDAALAAATELLAAGRLRALGLLDALTVAHVDAEDDELRNVNHLSELPD